MRTGARALSLLSIPLNVRLLSALQEEERSLADLTHAVGLPPASTLRTYLRTLVEWGALERRQEPAFPGSVRYALTTPGERLVEVGAVLQMWLKEAPNGGMALGSPAAKSAIKTLVDGWDAAVVRALVGRPCTLTELDRVIPQISYPALERRLTSMRRVGQVEEQPRNGNGRGTPYGATGWLREAVVPLVAAIAWERGYAPEATAAIGRLDVESVYLLALPQLEMPANTSGSCRLAVQLGNGSRISYAGATVSVRKGKPVAAVARLDGDPDAGVAGTALGWFQWIIGRGDEGVEVTGNSGLAFELAAALREKLVPSGFD